jgi:hypothetical protein
MMFRSNRVSAGRTFRKALLPGLIAAALLCVPGCGGMSQDDMMQYALKSPPEVDAPAAPLIGKTKQGGAAPNARRSASSAAQRRAANPPPTSDKAAKTAAPRVASAAPKTAPPADAATQAPASAAATGPVPSDTQSPPPTPLSADDRARRTVENMKRIGQAFQEYLKANSMYPPQAIVDTSRTPLLSWRVQLLPYLGHKELYSKFRLNEPWDSNHNSTLLAHIPSVYQSPERFDERTNYLVPVGSSTAFARARPLLPSNLQDGAANTVFVVEADDALAVPWTQPTDYSLDARNLVKNLGSLRGNSFYVLWGNGDVGRVLSKANAKHVRAMYSVDGGEDFIAGTIDQPLFANTVAAAGSADRPASPDGMNSPSTASVAEISALATKYFDNAAAAAAIGNQRDARQWFCAAAVANPPGGSWAQRYQWIPALKRPAPMLQFGIGLQYSGRQRSQLEQNAVARGPDGKSPGKSALTSITGKIGDAIINALTSHVAKHNAMALDGATRDERVVGSAASRAVQRARRSTLLQTSLQADPIAPGVVFLTIANEPLLKAMARREAVDVLVLVDWQDLGHQKSVRLDLIDVARDVSIFQFPWADSAEVAEALSHPLGDNPIARGMRQLGEFLEQQLVMQPLPGQIQPRHVVGRLAMLAASKSENPLATLAEMRYYRERGLADDAQLLLAYQTLLGPQAGSELFLGDAPTRERVLKPWLPPPDPPGTAPLRTAAADED